MYRSYSRDTHTFEKPKYAVSYEELNRLYGNLTIDALYQHKHYLESLKNPSKAVLEKIHFIRAQILRQNTSQGMDEA